MKSRYMKYAAAGLAVMALSQAAPARQRSAGEKMDIASGALLRSCPGMMQSPTRGDRLEVMAEGTAWTVIGFEGGAHAYVSNDDLLPPLLGYSADEFDATGGNPGLRWWLAAVEAAARDLRESGVRRTPTVPDPARWPEAVPQLLSDVWGQMEPFNDLCPMEYDAAGRPVGRSVVGCVATSASQVMHYHRYPPCGEGIHIDMQTEDAHGNPIPLKVDFADYPFDWDLMPDSYSPGTYTAEQGEAVARLCYPVGVSFGMIYGAGASGTYSDSAAVSLREHLRFPEARLMDRRQYEESEWMETIYTELAADRPILYSGADNWGVEGGGGHAFVLDGYDPDGLVHVNWGWYGRNNGYYEVALLNPRIHSFVNSQDMIIGVAPPDTQRDGTVRLTGPVTADELREAVRHTMDGTVAVLDLSGAELPEGRLPEMAFSGSRAEVIKLPASLRSVGAGFLAGCRRLRSVELPEAAGGTERDFLFEEGMFLSADRKDVISIVPYLHNRDNVCEDYTSLLAIPDGTERILGHAADGCRAVQGVEIPASVTWIGAGAFDGCTALKSVRLRGRIPAQAAARAFGSLDPGYTALFLPAGSTARYARAAEWKRFFAYDNVYEYGTEVRADDIVRLKGDPDPELTYRVFGDYAPGRPELTCDATAESPAGEYAVKVSAGTMTGEDITFTDGVLRVLDPAGIGAAQTGEDPGEAYLTDGRRASGCSGAGNRIRIMRGKKTVAKQ